jgi:hypothetical protein
MTIQRTKTSPWALHYTHPVIPLVPSAPALASCVSTNLKYVFTFETLNFNLDTMVYSTLNCVRLFIRYIRLVTTPMLHTLPHAVGYFHVVHCVLRIEEWCSEVFDHSVRMHFIMVDLGSREFRLRIWLGAHGGSQISTGREGIAGASASDRNRSG